MKRKDLLPAGPLAAAGSGGGVSLRAGKGPRVVVTLHGARCLACQRYLETLAVEGDAAAEWGGRFIAVVPGPAGGAPEPAGIRVVEDPGGAVADGRARVAVADEWGEVFFAADAGVGHDLPGADELVDWLRFVAIQCPECENPEGAWRAL